MRKTMKHRNIVISQNVSLAGFIVGIAQMNFCEYGKEGSEI